MNPREEAEACLKYIKTKFVRALLGIRKVTQDNAKDTWRYVLLQRFGAGSDIDWSEDVAGIDRQLWDKYGLNDTEKEFIDSKIRPME